LFVVAENAGANLGDAVDALTLKDLMLEETADLDLLDEVCLARWFLDSA
jgi:hypothetical protein